MMSVLILEANGDFLEKNIPRDDIDNLDISNHVNNCGINKPKELLKLPFGDKNISYLGWTGENSQIENIHKINLNFKNIVYKGDIVCYLSDIKNNYLQLNKNIYLNEFIPFITEKFEKKKDSLPTEDSDIEEYEDNLKQEKHTTTKFNLQDYVKNNFI